MRLKLSVFWRVRLEYMMSLWRDSTSGMLRGSTPRALNRSTWNTSEERSSSWSSRYCSGVLETMPPSQ